MFGILPVVGGVAYPETAIAIKPEPASPRRSFVDPTAAGFAVLAGLPNAAGADVQTRQPAAAVGPGVDADRVLQHQRPAAPLLGVATDHGLAGVVWRSPL